MTTLELPGPAPFASCRSAAGARSLRVRIAALLGLLCAAPLAPGQTGRVVHLTAPQGVVEMKMAELEAMQIDEGGLFEAGMAADGMPAGAVGVAPPQPPSSEEIALLRALHDARTREERDEMKAFYRDLGLDLDALLGLTTAAQAEAQRLQELLNTMRELNFTRTPQAVLAARSRMGFGQVPSPNPETARGGAMARWIHLQVMAGEWDAFAAFLAGRPPEEAGQIYARVLQALNQPNAGLLPEEVLALAEACPEAYPRPWQMSAWASMLKFAAERNSAATMLAAIRDNTRLFGPDGEERRRRTVELLAGAGLVRDAYDYLPPIEEARAQGDGALILVHGRHRNELASKAESGPEADGHRKAAWELFTEVSRLDRAPIAVRKEAIVEAVGLMGRMPRPMLSPWLHEVFADDAIAPALLETIALSAASAPSRGQDDEARAESMLALKEAVDILLRREDIDRAVLRVPLRMLTTALVLQMENAVAQRGRQRTVPRETQLLMRAIPGRNWLDALEPSLAVRAARACIAIAAVADETDLALGLVTDAVRRNPGEAAQFGESFLAAWMMRLAPKSDFDDEMMIYYFWREYVAQAPLTRGRQRRNLERLGRMMETIAEAGVDPRTLPGIALAFKACHGITEVYERTDIERVFGPLDAIPPGTAAMLAGTMAASLNGDWRNRAVQVQQGVRRTDTEIAQLVDRGYGLAIELIDGALLRQPESWRYAILKAGLTYDRMQFRAAQRRSDEVATDIEYRAAVFAAFEQAAGRYAQALDAGEEREDIGVFERWFGAAMGTSQLNFLTADGLPEEGSVQDDQVQRIRRAILALPPEAAFRHMSDFARTIGDAVGRSDPDVKPRLVRHALRVVGDHPAGASLRALDELYRDLVKDEIKLRLTIDGPDSVGTGRPFGVLVSLRFTNAVDRETGGFAKYLQTSAFVRVGRQYQEVNFREKLQKSIESAFGKGFTVDAIGWFDPFMPARGVIESGQDGWLEKPMAYVVVSRRDPAVDRLPQLAMDMQFEDSTGPVTLVLPSNTPAIAVAERADLPVRPTIDLSVTQVADPRDAADGEGERTIKLEIICRGKGTVPDFRELLAGFEDAVEGYEIPADGIVESPPVVLQEGDTSSQTMTYFWGGGPPKPPEGGYPEPDADGMYRLTVERAWTITYVPRASSPGREFRLPTLRDGVQATLESRWFSDMDLVPATAGIVPIGGRSPWRGVVALGLLGALAGVGAAAWRRRRRASAPVQRRIALPDRATPLSTVTALRRIAREADGALDADTRARLDEEIATIELKCFGPGGEPAREEELSALLRRWSETAVPRGT